MAHPLDPVKVVLLAGTLEGDLLLVPGEYEDVRLPIHHDNLQLTLQEYEDDLLLIPEYEDDPLLILYVASPSLPQGANVLFVLYVNH